MQAQLPPQACSSFSVTVEGAPLHEHQLNRIMVYLTDATIRVTGADGKSEVQTHKAGDIATGSAGKHSEQNIG